MGFMLVNEFMELGDGWGAPGRNPGRLIPGSQGLGNPHPIGNGGPAPETLVGRVLRSVPIWGRQ